MYSNWHPASFTLKNFQDMNYIIVAPSMNFFLDKQNSTRHKTFSRKILIFMSDFILGLRGCKHYLSSCPRPVSGHRPIQFWRPGWIGGRHRRFRCLTYYQSFDLWWGQKSPNVGRKSWIHHFWSRPFSRFEVLSLQ